MVSKVSETIKKLFPDDFEEFKPEYAKFGKAATHIRNDVMIKNADRFLCFWDGKSKGTKSVIKKIEPLHLSLIII